MTNPIASIPSLGLSPLSSGLNSMSPLGDASMPMALQQALEIQPHAASAISQTVENVYNTQIKSLKAMDTLNPLNGPETHTDAQLRQVSENFEAIFIQMLLSEMRKSVEKSNLFGNTQADQFFESLKDQEVAQQLSKTGGIGIGNIIYQQLKKATESHIKAYS